MTDSTATPELSKADRDAIAQRALVEIEERKRAGTYSSGAKAHTEYEHRPLDWMVEKMGVDERTIRWSAYGDEYEDHEWDGTVDPLVEMLESVGADEDCAAEAGTGTGKSFTLALIVFWALATHENGIVLTAAPKQSQLLLNVWKYIGMMWPKFQAMFPQAQLLSGKIRMAPQDEGGDEKWAATAFVAGVSADEEVAQKAKGFHGWYMLWITEETPGMNPAIMKTIANTRTGTRNPQISVGQPTHQHDELHTFGQKPWVKHVRISSLDYPNVVLDREVVEGAVTRQHVERCEHDYGRDGRLFLTEVRGISPSESEEALIRRDWCEAATELYSKPEMRIGVGAFGVDCADSPKGDDAAIADFLGACLTEVRAFKVENANKLGEQVANLMKVQKIDPRYVGVDPVGVGAGTVNELKRLGYRVRHLGGARKAVPGLDKDTLWSQIETDLEGEIKPAGPSVVEAERFNNLRSQIYWRLREDIRKGNLALPHDEKLFDELTAIEWEQKNGIICVSKKEDIKSKLKRSPNRADAVAYGNFVRRREPIRPPKTGIPENTAHRDYGLERIAAKYKKNERARKQRVQRQIRRMKQGRGRGRRVW